MQWRALGIVIAIAFPFSTATAETLSGINTILAKLKRDHNIATTYNVTVNPQRSMGAAAIFGTPHYADIWLHPSVLSAWDTNTWAFVLGHEISHIHYNLPGGTPRNEFECDYRGALLAVRSGFDAQRYIDHLNGSPNNCSPTHGCVGHRAQALAERLELSVTNKHPASHMDFPPTRGWQTPNGTTNMPCTAPVHQCNHGDRCHLVEPTRTVTACQHRIPCEHRIECTHRIPCQHQIPCQHRIPCTHRIPCQHVNMFGQRLHAFDTLHPFDTQHAFDLAHPYDLAHPFDLAHPYDLAHPEGDIQLVGGVPAPYCLMDVDRQIEALRRRHR